jgi:asparagine synthetase B (glutamine-hydrolysing)
MCSFLITNRGVFEVERVNQSLQPRGPDFTNLIVADNFRILHNLLSITSPMTPQPYYKNGVFVVFNGEIYNKRSSLELSDVATIYDIYSFYGEDFAAHLDGEYAITILDFNKGILCVSSDTFGTKPLYTSVEPNGLVSIATYSDALQLLGCCNIQKFKPNTTQILDLRSGAFLRSFRNITFCLRQFQNSFEPWAEAFDRSLDKRTRSSQEKGVFIGLSSGYDSGAIAAWLLGSGTSFSSFTHLGREDQKILRDRKKLMSACKNIDINFYRTNFYQRARAQKEIASNVPVFNYTIYSSTSDYNEFDLDLSSDNGAIQFYLLCEKAAAKSLRISLSGIGPDEIFSDYGFQGKKLYPHSNFGGIFPDNLEDIFPWPSFFGSTLESYIAKEEHIAGYFGIENRYPFLDVQVVQEFLNLLPSLKNSHYKAPLHFYLSKKNFPFKEGSKIGF